MNKFYIEIEQGKSLANRINELEGIIKILNISDIIKNNIQEIINEIKDILKKAKLKEGEEK